MNYLIVGSGIAGVSALKEILNKSGDKDNITLISKDSYPFYYRPRLIEYLSGEISISDIIVHDESWFESNNVDLRLNEEVTVLDSQRKVIKTDKAEYNYDQLLLATGAHSFVPPIPGVEKKNIFTLRNAEDAIDIYNQAEYSQAEKNSKAVVVGGGLLGLESAYNLHKSGLEVTVIEVEDWLLPRQLDKKAGDTLQKMLEEKGLEFYVGKKTSEFVGDEKIEGVLLENDKLIKSDMALLSTGIRSNIGIFEEVEGLEVDRAIVVDEQMETKIEDIYAAGDIAIVNGHFYGLWNPAKLQGIVAGKNMVGDNEKFERVAPDHRLKVIGIDVVSIGKLDELDNYDVEVVEKETAYKKVVKDEDGNKVGAIIVGEFSDTNQIINEIE
jgi:nitrite reductase (NADH) large subunit